MMEEKRKAKKREKRQSIKLYKKERRLKNKKVIVREEKSFEMLKIKLR